MNRNLKLSWLLLMAGLVAGELLAQPVIQWQKTLGGSHFDEAHSIQQTNDGGYITVGRSLSNNGNVSGNHGVFDFWVVKLFPNGDIEWQKSFGGSNHDWGYSIRQTIDAGYVVAGMTESTNGDVSGNHGGKDVWVLKLNAVGNIEWQKTLGGTGWDEAWAIETTFDGGLIVAGRSNSVNGDVTGNHSGSLDFWVVKLSNNGVIEWQKSLGGTDEDFAIRIRQTSDGSYLVVGQAKSFDGDVIGNNGNVDFWIVKLNSLGVIEWQTPLGGGGLDVATDIKEIPDGYVAVGYVGSNDGDVTGHQGFFDLWIVKLDKSGKLLWQKTYGGTDADYARSMVVTHDGSFVVAGTVKSNDGDVVGNNGIQVIWVIKLDSNGDLIWKKAIGGTQGEGAYSIQQTNDLGYILAGFTWSNDGDVSGNHGQADFWIIKLAPESSATQEAPYSQLEVFPNPATQSVYLNTPVAETSLRVRVSDLLGREHLQQNLDGFNALDVSALAPGTYLVSASGESGKRYLGKFYKG